jgi:hypothetical protein
MVVVHVRRQVGLLRMCLPARLGLTAVRARRALIDPHGTAVCAIRQEVTTGR